MIKIPNNYKKLVEVFENYKHTPGVTLKGLAPEEIPKNPADFLWELLRNWYKKYDTINKNGRIITPSRENGMYRSFQEAYDILKSTFPKLTYKQFFQITFEYHARLSKTTNRYSACVFCHDIRKPVFLHNLKDYSMECDFKPKQSNFPYYWLGSGDTTKKFFRLLSDDGVMKYLLGNKYIKKSKN